MFDTGTTSEDLLNSIRTNMGDDMEFEKIVEGFDNESRIIHLTVDEISRIHQALSMLYRFMIIEFGEPDQSKGTVVVSEAKEAFDRLCDALGLTETLSFVYTYKARKIKEEQENDESETDNV